MTIVAAAVRINHCVCSMEAPARHHDILRQINGLYDGATPIDGNLGERPPWTYESETQGFIDDKGKFYNRAEAFKHCVEAGQPLARRVLMLSEGRNVYNGEDLYSEDLW
jgi:hypothetical protein